MIPYPVKGKTYLLEAYILLLRVDRTEKGGKIIMTKFLRLKYSPYMYFKCTLFPNILYLTGERPTNACSASLPCFPHINT